MLMELADVSRILPSEHLCPESPFNHRLAIVESTIYLQSHDIVPEGSELFSCSIDTLPEG